MHCSPKEEQVPDNIQPPGNFLQLQDRLVAKIRQASSNALKTLGVLLIQRDGLIWKENSIFVPINLCGTILERCHDHPLACHFGVHKTTELVQQYFWWPGLANDCRSYVLVSTVCARSKNSRTRAWGLLQPLPVPDCPWQMLSMDFIVELPPSEGNTAICIVVDRLTKLAHFVALQVTPMAADTAWVFIKEIVRLHGVRSNLVTDQEVQFTSQFRRALCKTLHIKVSLSSAYPQTHGQTERTNLKQTLEQYLCYFMSYIQADCASLLLTAKFAYNNSCHSTTN